MGVENLVVCRTDSEAAALIMTNVDERDHPFILGSTNPILTPLMAVMNEAEASGKVGDALQAIETAWLKQADLGLTTNKGGILPLPGWNSGRYCPSNELCSLC